MSVQTVPMDTMTMNMNAKNVILKDVLTVVLRMFVLSVRKING